MGGRGGIWRVPPEARQDRISQICSASTQAMSPVPRSGDMISPGSATRHWRHKVCRSGLAASGMDPLRVVQGTAEGPVSSHSPPHSVHPAGISQMTFSRHASVSNS